MGLIKQAVNIVSENGKDVLRGGLGAINSVLKDKFKSVIQCDALGDSILMMQKTTESGRIPRDSAVVVQTGQMAVIIDSGRVVDAVSEAGVYRFDESSTPCFAAGDFEGSLEEMWSRFTFGGDTFKTQQVYYFNTLEIRENGFGTRGPVPYKDWGHPVMNPRLGPNGQTAMSVLITAFGNYTFKIVDPALFMREVCGTAKLFEKSRISNQLQAEVIGAFQQLLNKMGTEDYQVPALDLSNASQTIQELLRARNENDSFAKRGLRLENITVENVKLDDASQKKIDQYELGGDQYTQRGVTTKAYGEAIVGAANNTAGVGSSVMGLGFLNMGNQMFQQGMAPPPAAAPAGGAAEGATVATGGVVCACGAKISGKFCPNCGKPAPAPQFCSNCGKPVAGKFCAECGKPVEQKKICPDCGIPVDGKFCPNCGKPVAP